MNSEEILAALEQQGLAKRKAKNLLRDACEISTTTGAEMLAAHGIPYADGLAYLNTSPQFGAKKPSPISLRKVLGLFFLVIAAVNFVTVILKIFKVGSFGHIGNAPVVLFIVFSILGRQLYREQKTG